MNHGTYLAITVANIATVFVCCTQATLRVVVLVMFSYGINYTLYFINTSCQEVLVFLKDEQEG
jgi:hypothetical protein